MKDKEKSSSKKSEAKKAIRRWTQDQIRAGRRYNRPIMLSAIASSLAGLGQMWCVAVILGTILVQWHGHRALYCPRGYFIAFILFVVVRALFMYGQDQASKKASIAARKRIRGEVMDRIIAGGPALLRTQHSAALATTAVDRVEALDGFFGHFVPASRLWVILPLLTLILVWFLQPFAAYTLALCGVAIPFGQALFGIGAMVASRKQFLAMTRLQTRFLDRIRGIATIVLAGRVDEEAQRLGGAAEELRKCTMKILRVAFFSSASIDCAMVVAFIVLAITQGHHVLAIEATASPVLLQKTVVVSLFSLLIVPEYFAPFRALALAYQDRAHAQGAASAILELPQPRPQENEKKDAGLGKKEAVSVTFEDISFSWDQRRGDVLKDVSFFVPPKSVMKIVGPSGVGKSTVLDLILGFVQPQKGHIYLNEKDIATLTPKQRAAQISWIGQRPVIFSASMRENILFAKPHAREEELEAAIDGSGIRQFLDQLPHGLETHLGEGGFGLSGGQAQRVVIARAWLKDAPLLLLDEPSSHLDKHAEEQLFQALEKLAQGRTVIIVTHAAQRHLLKGETLELQDGRVKAVKGSV